MPRSLSFLFGPEIYWIAICALVHFATRRHLPPTMAISSWLDHRSLLLPLLFVPLTFAFLFLSHGNRWGTLLRIDVAIAIGTLLAAMLLCNGMAYHQSRRSLSTGALMIIPVICFVTASLSTAVAATTIWLRSRGQN